MCVSFCEGGRFLSKIVVVPLRKQVLMVTPLADCSLSACMCFACCMCVCAYSTYTRRPTSPSVFGGYHLIFTSKRPVKKGSDTFETFHTKANTNVLRGLYARVCGCACACVHRSLIAMASDEVKVELGAEMVVRCREALVLAEEKQASGGCRKDSGKSQNTAASFALAADCVIFVMVIRGLRLVVPESRQ